MSNSAELTTTKMQIRRIDHATDPLAPQAGELIYRSVLYGLDPGHDAAAEYHYAFGSFDNFCAVEQPTGRLLGVAALSVSARQSGTGFIENVAVVPATRGQRVGASLIEHLEVEALHSGVTQLQVQSLHQAVGFYKKLGYMSHVRQIPDLLVKQLII